MSTSNSLALNTIRIFYYLMQSKYEKTIVEKHPEYISKTFFLANADKSGLYRIIGNNAAIEIVVHPDGNLKVDTVSDNSIETRLSDNISLRTLGELLGFKDPSVEKMLKYLVRPEMEVERIFNCLRFKYLSSLFDGSKPPQAYMSSEYNDLFKALIHGNFRGTKKGDLPAKWNSILKKSGFPENTSIDVSKEKSELKFMLAGARDKISRYATRDSIYMDTIAIKPGFHEAWCHDRNKMPAEFEKQENDLKPGKKLSRRDIALMRLHGYFKLDSDLGFAGPSLSYGSIGNELNAHSFLTYASCNITEGPFVSRTDLFTSYFNEINSVQSKGLDRSELEKKFFVLDYCFTHIDSKEQLAEFLKKAKAFTKF